MRNLNTLVGISFFFLLAVVLRQKQVMAQLIDAPKTSDALG